MAQRPRSLRCLNALQLKLLAMALMLCDHAWATIAFDWPWLTAIGRIAFPIFAFQIAEGYAHTRDWKRYWKRLFLFALISELPFNLMVGGGLLYPFHQNVMFTFCLALPMLVLLDKARRKGPGVFALAAAGIAVLSFLLGFITFVDYFGYGIWMVLLFYLCRGHRWGRAAELAGMIYINWVMIGGLVYPVTLFGFSFDIPEQGLAVLALIPIWLYNGRQGPHSRAIQYACYAFYPAHMLVLALLARLPL